MTRPSILDTHRRAAREPTPRWEATWRAFYGLELRPVDVENLSHATRRASLGTGGLSGTGRPMRELWCRVGRRGRKSFEAALVGVHEAAWGGHERYLVPGEKGLIAIISKDAAGSTLVANFAELHARALGFDTNWTSIGAVRVLEIAGIPFGIACFPCNGRAPRGFAVPVVIADEIAHWATDDEYVNADTAVLGAIKPAMAQFPDSKLIAISSPLGETGLHYETVEAALGDDAPDGVLAVEGPTWEWNPEITEARTHELERDPEVHAREFGAKPSGNESTAFVKADVALAYAGDSRFYHFGRPFMALDPASSSNTFAWLLARWGEPDRTQHFETLYADGPAFPPNTIPIGVKRDSFGCPIAVPIAERPILQVFRVGSWSGEELRQTTMDRVAGDIWEIAERAGANTIFSDQHGGVFLAALIAQASEGRANFRAFAQSQPSKHEAVTYLRTLMRDHQLACTEHAQMRRDLETYPRRIVGGGFKYGAPRGGHHWDFASALVIMAHSFIAQSETPDNVSGVDRNPARRFRGGRIETAR